MAASGGRALYISGEESAAQVRLRAERTGCVHDEVYLASESDLHSVLGHIEAVKPTLAIIDSVQTMSTTDADGVTGGVTQVRAVTTALTMAAKSSGVAMVLVGHVTKDGAIADRGHWNISSMWCCISRATNIPRCGWCAVSRIDSVPRTKSVAFSYGTRESSVFPTPLGFFWSIARRRRPVPR